MTTQAEITRVTIRWDDQEGCEPGWYCESWVGCNLVGDSQKVSFPVDVDDYKETDIEDLWEALEDAFPLAVIDLKN